MKIIERIKNKLIKISIGLRKETVDEKNNREELFKSIKTLHDKNTPVKSAWDRNRQTLRLYILKNDPRNFLRWPPVTGSMFFGDKHELDELMGTDWDKWSRLINETWVGNPPRYKYYKKSSVNLIHTAYNVSRLLKHCDIDFKNFKKIIEFGGGYGCMAKFMTDLGFTGKYIIFDIPEYLALQKYYLASTKTTGNFNFIDQTEKLEDSNPDLFIATWSLSETPFELRKAFWGKIGKPANILIAYQESFESRDNIEYFKECMENNPDYDWVNYEIPHMPRNYYLVGKKK